MANPVLIEDTFEVQEENPGGKKFDRVSRVKGTSENYGLDIVLDFHSQLLRLRKDDRFHLLLARTLNADGTPMDTAYDPTVLDRKTLADEFEYVMSGKVFKIEQTDKKKNMIDIFISYGGLLMSLKGDPKTLAQFEVDQRIYLLVRKSL